MPEPSFKYQRWYTNEHNVINAMQCPKLLGSPHNVKKASNVINKVKDNLENYALAYPIAGEGSPSEDKKIIANTNKGPYYQGTDRTLGSNYFLKMGKCGNDSDAECRGEDRYVYIRNIPKGGGFYNMTKCNIVGKSQGLIPGIIEDVQEVLFLGDAVKKKEGSYGSDKCVMREGKVGKNIQDNDMQCKYNTPSYDELYKCLYTENKSWWIEKRCTPQSKEYVEELYNNPQTQSSQLNTRHRWWYALGRLMLVGLIVICFIGLVREGVRYVSSGTISKVRRIKNVAVK
jgi:hypothetical protein